MLKYRNIIILLIVSSITIAGLYILTDVYLNIRFNELKLYLQESDRDESAVDHVQLVMKYDISKKLYEEEITEERADIVESRIDMLMAGKTTYETLFFKKYKYLSIPALYVINLNRFFMGKNPIRFARDEDTSEFLDIAYYYERNNLYHRAIEYYIKMLEQGGADRTVTGGIYLHLGFCHAMTGNYGEAASFYDKVIDGYRGEEIAVTAAMLLNYLKGFREEERRVMEEPDSIEKGKKLFRLMAYKKAINVFQKIGDEAASVQKAGIDYYRGRCYDEMGKKEQSVNSYLAAITASPDSETARLANRRLFMIGSAMSKDNRIKKLAVELNNRLNDKALNSMILSDDVIKPDIERDLIEEDIKIDNSLLERAEKISGASQGDSLVNKRVRISTRDGSLFVGSVIDSFSSHITLMTSIGRVNIRRDGILDIETIDK